MPGGSQPPVSPAPWDPPPSSVLPGRCTHELTHPSLDVFMIKNKDKSFFITKIRKVGPSKCGQEHGEMSSAVHGSLLVKLLTTKSNPQYLLKPVSHLFYN